MICNYHAQGTTHKSSLEFIENKGQWNSTVDVKLPLNSGDVYFEGVTTTYCLYDKSYYGYSRHQENQNFKPNISGHTYKVNLLGANPHAKPLKENKRTNYYNYLIGNDQSKWQKNVRSYEELRYQDLYPDIDQHFYDYYGKLKYDFIVHPDGDPRNISFFYEGVYDVKIEKGHLVVYTEVGEIIEQSPYAYQIIDGEEIKVDCRFVLRRGQVSFKLGGYDPNINLVIDPVLTFATYTGSSASNFGCTATNDLGGNMYVGGTVFGTGYPTTTGPFQLGFGNGIIDMGITKFSSDGTSMIYSTYIGGVANEIPHSLVVNDNDELIILGTSNSVDYPMGTNPIQNVMVGGAATTFAGYGFNYTNGCDIVVTKLNAAGNGIIGSTFLGGQGNDGIIEGSILHYNYGDAFRGEIINGINGEIWIASTTSSFDFPVSANAYQTNLNGPSDAVLIRLNSDLSSIIYSTYLGGSSFDSGYSVQLNSNNEPYMCGGTISSDFPNTANGVNPNFSGGDADGFIAHFDNSGATYLNGTYLGTSEYDQCYFVQTDLNDDVFTIGQTTGAYPHFNNGYGNLNSGQFIHKLTPNLGTSMMSTTIGRGSGEVDLAVNAFLVSDCDFIYFSGWGGPLNGNTALGAMATSSVTLNLPVTNDAFQPNSDGADFYLCVLGPDASSLLYGTYFGGATSAEHADGGTSRFDKNGTVYQAVCAGCGGNDDFPTTPGAWSNLNNSTNCNLGAFKFDLGSITPSLSVPQPYVCLPSNYQFANSSSGGNQFFWDFGDGNSSTDFAPSHNYQDTGNYEIQLIVSDSLGCLANDTAYLYVDVFEADNAEVQLIDTICRGDSVLLLASGGVTYQWSPTQFLSDPNGQNTYAFPPTTTSYTVVATDSCGSDTAQIEVHVYTDTYDIMDDTTICSGFPTSLWVTGGVSYNWAPHFSLQNVTSSTPNVNPGDTTTYYCEITLPSGCVYIDSVTVNTVNNVPFPDLNDDTTICAGDQMLLNAFNGDSYDWYPTNLLTNINGGTATTNIDQTSTIYVDVNNSCGTVSDSVIITVIDVYPQICDDTIICPGDSALLFASGGIQYIWNPQGTLSHSDSSTTWAFPDTPTTYEVEVFSPAGCGKTLSVTVDMYLPPFVDILTSNFVNYGHEVNLNANTNATSFLWSSQDSIYCDTCLITNGKPVSSTEYILEVTDDNGCINSDTILVYMDGALYVPNTFTPNGDGINDFFQVKGEEIKSFELLIFNRWGQLLFETANIDGQWDGTFKGKPVQMDAYVWKVEFIDFHNKYFTIRGHVNVIR